MQRAHARHLVRRQRHRRVFAQRRPLVGVLGQQADRVGELALGGVDAPEERMRQVFPAAMSALLAEDALIQAEAEMNEFDAGLPSVDPASPAPTP